MNLVTLRQKFVELSGHYDLVVDTTDWADNGADFYINAGQQFLDTKSNVWKKTGKVYRKVSAGEWYISFQRCRVIEEVYANDTTSRIRLTKKDFHFLHEGYPGLISAIDQGTPLYFAPGYLRGIEYDDIDALGEFFNHIMVDSETYRGILIMPPPSSDFVIEVIGQFYIEELENDTDENFWTLNHSSILLLAALYQLEILAHRNTQGANDYLAQLDHALFLLDKDMADEESYGITQMEG
jgi:hypothetical protein